MLAGRIGVSQHIGSKFRKIQGIIHEALLKFFASIAYSMGIERAATKNDDGELLPPITTYSTWLKEQKGKKLSANDF